MAQSSVIGFTQSRIFVLKDYAKVNGREQISHSASLKLLNQYVYSFEYITMSVQGVDVLNLVWVDSAITHLHMRENTCFHVCVFLLTHPSANFNI